MMNQKHGISLIVLVITIIIMVILAATVVISLSNTGIIGSAENATEKTNIKSAQEILTVRLLELQKPGEVTKNGRITLSDLIVLNYEVEDPDMVVETEYLDSEQAVKIYNDEDLDYTRVAVDKYIFKVNSKFGVEYLQKGEFGEVKEPELTGTGTAEDPYIIRTVKHLKGMKDNLSAHYKLGNSINLRSESNWEPIGTAEVPFTGTLDGQGFAIKNMKITNATGYAGLFGKATGATISNLVIDNYSITGSGNYIGGLIGHIENSGLIIRVRTNGTIITTGTSSNIGGIVGAALTKTSIKESLTEGTISSKTNGTNVGGIVGYAAGNPEMGIYNSYSTMNVSGLENVGGLAGYMQSAGFVTSYGIGKVEGTTNVGAIGGAIGSWCASTNSYWNKSVSGQTSGNLGDAKVISALSKQATYTDWDFETIWGIDEGKSTAYLKVLNYKPTAIYDVVENNIEKGEGTLEDPYIIKTVDDLKAIKNNLSAYYKLANNIDLSSESNWEPIGSSESVPFKGGLDGQGFSIKNMKITTTAGVAGFFGWTSNTTISNLVIDNYTITGEGKYVGGLAGYLDDTSLITNVRTKGNITATGTMTHIGGIAGVADNNTTINKCFSEGNIDSLSQGVYVGGISGFAYSLDGTTTISNSYSLMNVNGSNQVAGLLGYVYSVKITNSYSIGKVEGVSNVGGLIGSNSSSNITSSYWDTSTSGQTTSVLGTGKTTTEMKTKSTYSGWDFDTIWQMTEGSYPTLR